MRSRAIPDYRGTEGFVRLDFLRRLDTEAAHFQLTTFWNDLDSIRKFAGEEYQRAKYYPEDHDYLLEFEEYVIHFEVFASENSDR